MRFKVTFSTYAGSAPFTKMGPVMVCGPRPGWSVRSFLISSMVRPGSTWLCECIIVSSTTVSPESTVRTGAWALSNQPHCVVSRVAGRTWTLPGKRLALTTACEWAARGTRPASAKPQAARARSEMRVTFFSLGVGANVATILQVQLPVLPREPVSEAAMLLLLHELETGADIDAARGIEDAVG